MSRITPDTEHRHTAGNGDPRTLGQLMSDLGTQANRLMQQQIELAKTEMRRIGREVAKDSTMLIAGAVVAFFAAMTLVGALAAALTVAFALVMSIGIAVWLGPLVTAVLLGIVAAVMIQIGRRRLKQARLQPEHTKQSLREDVQWIKHQFQ